MTHHCPGSLAIAEQVIAQCEDDADIASRVLVLAAVIAGIKAGRHAGEMMRDLSLQVAPAEVLAGIERRLQQ